MQKDRIIKTHTLLIEKVSTLGLLSDYSYFLQFKYTFSSSSVNKGAIKAFSEKIGLSYKTVRTKIKKFIDLNWAYIREDGAIVFKSNKELYKQYKFP